MDSVTICSDFGAPKTKYLYRTKTRPQVGLRRHHYKASGGDGNPVELFQILKDDAIKVLHSICQQKQDQELTVAQTMNT